MRRLLLGLVLVISACGDDDTNGGTIDAGGATIDARSPDASVAMMVERGRYLVENVLACVDCHTPRLPSGAFDETKKLSGVECFADTSPPADNGAGCLHTRNLTNHATGLMNRSNAEIKAMFQTGVRPGGTFLFPVMPYWLLKNLTDADADAIVAYLRTVPGVDHQVPPSEAPFNNVPAATAPAVESDFPAAGGTGDVKASAERGRYIAKLICVDCHTEENPPGNPKPLKLEKAFQGGRLFTGFPSPPFPADGIYTVNLTPHATGLMGWTVADVVKVLKQGKDRTGGNVCPPMPAGPTGPFGGMTDADATDVANYILNLPAANNIIAHQCVAP